MLRAPLLGLVLAFPAYAQDERKKFMSECLKA
jgi:hypothetical protein